MLFTAYSTWVLTLKVCRPFKTCSSELFMSYTFRTRGSLVRVWRMLFFERPLNYQIDEKSKKVNCLLRLMIISWQGQETTLFFTLIRIYSSMLNFNFFEYSGSQISTNWTHLSINDGHLSSQHHAPYNALHLHALEWRPLRLGVLHGSWNGPFMIQIHFHVGVWLIRKVEDPLRIGVKFRNNVLNDNTNIYKWKKKNFAQVSKWIFTKFSKTLLV